MVAISELSRSDDEAPSLAVVHAIAAAEDVPPERLSLVLHDAIDPEALDMLASSGRCEITFSVRDYEVTVTSGYDDQSETRVRIDHT